MYTSIYLTNFHQGVWVIPESEDLLYREMSPEFAIAAQPNPVVINNNTQLFAEAIRIGLGNWDDLFTIYIYRLANQGHLRQAALPEVVKKDSNNIYGYINVAKEPVVIAEGAPAGCDRNLVLF